MEVPNTDTVWRETFEGENFRELVKNTTFAKKTYADCSLLLHQHMPPPKFRGENFHEQPHNCEICESFLSQTFPAIQHIGGQLPSMDVPNTDTLMSWYE